jgi:hypothetical protein
VPITAAYQTSYIFAGSFVTMSIEVIRKFDITSIDVRALTMRPSTFYTYRSDVDASIGIYATGFSKESSSTTLITVYK